MLKAENNLKATGESEPFPHSVLEKIASRFRPAGVCLFMAGPDGSIVYSDPVAGAFYARYVAPQVKQSGVLAEKLRRLPVDAPAVAFDSLPGIVLAAIPYVERRQILGIPLLAARTSAFRTGEDVLQVCGRLQVDAAWLSNQADSLPGYSREALTRQVSLAGGMLHDQLKLSGMEFELHSLSEQLANSYEELSLIYQISGGMRVNRGASDFFRQACQDVLDVMNVQGVGVCLMGDGESRVEPVLYGSAKMPNEALRRFVDNLLPVLRKRKGPLLVADTRADEAFAWTADSLSSFLAVPLQRQDQVLGCMFAVNKEAGVFDSVDSKLLNSIATESAIYVENSSLYSDVHGLMMGLLHSLTSAVDAKDAYTCGHSERVALLSRHIALEIGLPDTEVEEIYMAGLLHDVGKIGVPESVLQKTGKLTSEEFDLMKKHPQIGARILADVKQVKALIPGVLHHHERYDGKGYPTGLSGTNIPLMGRIICLADCFDAMTSNRTYRKALPIEVAVTEIRRCAGTQFDPALAESFVKTGPDRFRELLRNHAEKSKMLLELQETLRAS
jgi:HD-GYP domain-containing protein (c-di-GMP phosphodiesterase class II)